MSLLTDRDYLLHSLRLDYVRNVLPNHAPQGSSTGVGPHNLIDFDPTSPVFNSPYVVLSGLADGSRWPELSSGRSSPPLAPMYGRSEYNGTDATGRRRHGGSSTLDYAQTIGKGPGGAGMRVGGRARGQQSRKNSNDTHRSAVEAGAAPAHPGFDNLRRSSSLEATIHRKRLSDSLSTMNAHNAPPVVVHSPTSPLQTPFDSAMTTVDPSLSTTPDASSSALDSHIAQNPAQLDSAIFKAKAQVDSPDFDADLDAPVVLPSSSSAELDNSSYELPSAPLSPVSGPDIAQPTSPLSLESPYRSTSPPIDQPASLGPRYASAASSGVSLFGVSRMRANSDAAPIVDRSDGSSASAASGPQPPNVIQPPHFRARERRRVNISGGVLLPIAEPVHEGEQHDAAAAGERPDHSSYTDDSSADKAGAHLRPPLRDGPPAASSSSDNSGSAPSDVTSPRKARSRVSRHNSDIVFVKRSDLVPQPLTVPAAPRRSALTAMLSAQSSSTSGSNPFSSLYAAVITRASDALKLTLYFPHSGAPSKPLQIGVKKDVSVEEVIGAGLWAYWEEGREPQLELDPAAGGETGQESTKWNLRIVEDDGEVDEDFPALDRTKGISAFSFGEFAIVKATERQITDNQAKQATIVRRPSRVLAAPRRSTNVPPTATNLVPPAAQDGLTLPTAQAASPAGGQGQASFRPSATMGVTSGFSVPVLLKVRLPPTPGVVEVATTINVPNDMYMSDVLDHICQKRGLDNPKDWALVVQHNNSSIVVPLDRTVDSLGSQHELSLVRRNQLQRGVSNASSTTGGVQNVDPSASIFKRLSSEEDGRSTQQPRYQSAMELMDLTTNYKKWNVQRKLPVPLGRHPRTIAIDGDYLHFMPSDTKGVVEGGRTTSLHVSLVLDCRLSRRAPNLFKIIVHKNHRAEKRYDFEAEDGKQAVEIVEAVRRLMSGYREQEEQRQRLGGVVAF